MRTTGERTALLVDEARAAELTAASLRWQSVTLSAVQLAELELRLSGGYPPRDDPPPDHGHDGPASSASPARTPSAVASPVSISPASIFPVPASPPAAPGHPPASPLPAHYPTPQYTVDAGDAGTQDAEKFQSGSTVALRDSEGVMLAALHLTEVVGSTLSGTVEGLRLPERPDYPELRFTPAALRAELLRRGWTAPNEPAPVAVWADGLLHTADLDRIEALGAAGGAVVVLAPVGGADPADARHHLRIRCLKAALATLSDVRALLALVPVQPVTRLTESVAFGPNTVIRFETVTDGGRPTAAGHAVSGRAATAGRQPAGRPGTGQERGTGRGAGGRDGGGSGGGGGGDGQYQRNADQETDDRDSEPALAGEVAYRTQVCLAYGFSAMTVGPAPSAPGAAALSMLLDRGTRLPPALTPPAVAAELVRAQPPRSERGLTVLFTGLSGSGKSTLAKLLVCRLLERGDRRVTLLDGDVVRLHLSKGLGFSREDRNANVLRIGFVAASVTAAGGTAVCAPIAPYDDVRHQVRTMVEDSGGGFVLVHVATPLQVCEARDRKGLYAKARAGIIPTFTGVSDPYEEPTDADIVIDTVDASPHDAVQTVLSHLRTDGWLAP
ncbi:adenylyl-sulfate kinase [Protofrankia coriariae]|uniref:adenylyl-sulfate kinase n=1 Tax=Protofrankia coriariae TaxID=1562887 RepID=UPI00069BAF50|nr:adenylyl-sulfate kinase [Protofrankia coriariae]